MSSEQKLHPLSFLFIIGSTLGNLLLPLLAVVFLARSGGWQVWTLVLVIPYLAAAIINQLSYRYRIDADELVIKSGVLFKSERRIRYARIQNVETLDTPFHRWFRVMELRIETAGGEEPEARMRVLSREAADELRRRLFEHRQQKAAELQLEEDRHVLLKLSLRELLILGLVDNRGLLVAAAAAGVVWEMDLLDFDDLRAWSLWEFIRGLFTQGGSKIVFEPRTVGIALGLLLASVLAVRILSIGWAMWKLHGFTLTATDADLKSSGGLFSRVHTTIPKHRIQLLTITETPLQRLARRVGISVETAGGKSGDDESSVTRQWIAPILPRQRAAELIREIEPDLDLESIPWRPVDPRARWRLLRAYSWLSLLATTALVWALKLWGLLLFPPFFALAWMGARESAARMGYALTGERMLVRGGWWWRHLSVARFAKFQAASVEQSPFDRRWRMADLAADTAGGGSHPIRIGYLPDLEARAVFDHIATRASETDFRWS